MTIYNGPIGQPAGVPKDSVAVGYVPGTNVRVYRSPDGSLHVEDNAVLPA